MWSVCCWCCSKKRCKSFDVEDLTKEEIPSVGNITAIEELKLKLGSNRETSECETSPVMIPDAQKGAIHHHLHPPAPPPPPLLSEDGLIIPKKPPNPVKENSERQNLHRELLFNQKIGKNVLNQKSELQRALDRQKEHLAKKEFEIAVASHTPELEKVIADRAKRRLHQDVNNDDDACEDDHKVISQEFIQARMKLKNRSDSK